MTMAAMVTMNTTLMVLGLARMTAMKEGGGDVGGAEVNPT